MTDTNHAQDQARAQYESICEMIGAVSTDWDRLEELKEARDDFEAEDGSTWEGANPEDATELAALELQANGNDDEDAARQAIQDDPLSVEVRSGWASVGDTLEASEFCILLCTGGPAVRIMGELNQHNEPSRAWLEYQDWGTPWTQYHGAEQTKLIEYAQAFYFGE